MILELRWNSRASDQERHAEHDADGKLVGGDCSFHFSFITYEISSLFFVLTIDRYAMTATAIYVDGFNDLALSINAHLGFAITSHIWNGDFHGFDAFVLCAWNGNGSCR